MTSSADHPSTLTDRVADTVVRFHDRLANGGLDPRHVGDHGDMARRLVNEFQRSLLASLHDQRWATDELAEPPALTATTPTR